MSAMMLDNQPPPEPMAALTHTVISPSNIALEERLSRAKPLTRFQVWKLKRQIARLRRELGDVDTRQIEAELRAIQPGLSTLLDYKFELAQQRQLAPDDKHLATMWQELRENLEPQYQLYKSLKTELAQVKHVEQLQQQLDDNPRVIERAAIEEEKMKIQRQEAKSYVQLIVTRWTQQGFCYRYSDGKGNRKVDEVRIVERHITPEAIFLKIGVSERHWSGGYRSLLPYGVSVSDLVKPETLEELSYACQRQVSAKSDFVNGSWIIVNRLDTTDGLLNQVRYVDVMQRYPAKYHVRVPICAGVAQRKQVQWLNLTDYPHGLIAGFTGSGKSNFVNAIICTLISKHDPKDLRLILVDLKEGVEFAVYDGIPHLYGPIVEKVPDLANKLEEVLAIMLQRYQKLRGKALSLNAFNAKHPEEHMARIIVIIDEVVSTIDNGDYTKRISAALKQLVARGRAAGVHIILSTQRPSVDAIQGLIKVNLSFRIVGRMPSHTDSLTVLGSGAAKDLPAIPGRMVLQLGPDPLPVQTPMIEEHDVVEALKIAMAYARPDAIPLPENVYTQTEWTPERIVALSLNHLGGNISHTRIWEEIKEDGSLSRAQTRELCERIWAMDCISFEGKQYRMKKGKSAVKHLIEIEPEGIPESEDAILEHDTSLPLSAEA